MLANLATPALAMIDASILGHLSNPAFLAALSISTGLFAYILWGFNCISLSCSTFTATANAQQDFHLVCNRLYQYSFISVCTAIILFIAIQIGLDPLLNLIQVSNNLKTFVSTYLKIMSFGIVPLLFIQAAIAWFTGIKRPKIALYVLIISSTINAILDVYFVFVLNMNIDGVALASVIAQFITACFVLIFILFSIKNNASNYSLDPTIWIKNKQVFDFGGTLLLRSGILLSVFLIFNLKGASINETTAASNALLLTIVVLISSVLDASASSAQVQIANHPKQQSSILISTFVLMCCFVFAFLVLILSIGKLYLGFMSNQTMILEQAYQYLPWIGLLCLTSCTSYWLDGVFLGWQKSSWMRNSVLIAALCGFFPWTFGFNLTNHQLWFCLNLFMFYRSLVMWIYFLQEKNRLKNKVFES
ncbi:MATE family efflux transporter [Marinicellulosiphila megalodicopiae]|uniref:MATE family efflux transporter n=1 Tax=Marinicellulosiphila megalodicopiae TaxID=2724896 RepID=UPI003BB12D80